MPSSKGPDVSQTTTSTVDRTELRVEVVVHCATWVVVSRHGLLIGNLTRRIKRECVCVQVRASGPTGCATARVNVREPRSIWHGATVVIARNTTVRGNSPGVLTVVIECPLMLLLSGWGHPIGLSPGSVLDRPRINSLTQGDATIIRPQIGHVRRHACDGDGFTLPGLETHPTVSRDPTSGRARSTIWIHPADFTERGRHAAA